MTEFNKIVRYIVPVFILAGYTFMFISVCLLPNTFFYQLVRATNLDLSLLVPCAGGAGFLLSIIHHWAFWHLPFYPKPRYKSFFAAGARKKLITFEGKPVKELDEQELWRIINIVWHRLRHEDLAHEKVNSRNDSLTDLMHGNGTTLIALLLSGLLTVLYLAFYSFTSIGPITGTTACFRIAAALLFIVLLLLHVKIYKFSASNLNRFVEETLFHTLMLRAQMSKPGTNEAVGPLRFYLKPNNDA